MKMHFWGLFPKTCLIEWFCPAFWVWRWVATIPSSSMTLKTFIAIAFNKFYETQTIHFYCSVCKSNHCDSFCQIEMAFFSSTTSMKFHVIKKAQNLFIFSILYKAILEVFEHNWNFSWPLQELHCKRKWEWNWLMR